MTYVYLDWNVFNKIEKIDQLDSQEKNVYSELRSIIKQSSITTPYSNAHIHDLIRGYHKNPDYINKHLETLSELSSNLCITQYWGESETKWHIREPKEYFDSALEESDNVADSFSGLFDSFKDEPLLQATWEIRKTLLKWQPVDESFKKIYSADPFFSVMFPRTKEEMNQLALCEDIFSFSNKIKSDYTLYKNYKKFLNQLRMKLPQYQKLYNTAQNQIIGVPKYLTWDEMWEQSKPNFRESSNPNYDKILTLFTTTDLKGYRQDERFANLIDDSLHCFYGAHCQYFVTIDGRCYDKAKKVYEKLKITTIVAKPQEFMCKT